MRKIRNTGVAIDVSHRIDDLLERFGEIPGLVALYLYGSYDTPDQTPLSDVDLAAVFAPGETPDGRERIALAVLATEALGEVDVSLSILDDAPVRFQHKVLRTGRVLLLNDPAALADFQERVVKRYCDFALDYREIVRDYDTGLREAYGSGRS